VLANSPGCSIHDNLLYQWFVDTVIWSSPNTSYYRNTAVAAAETSLIVGFGSAPGSYIAMNSLNCNEDQAIELYATTNELAQLTLDYNNYGTVFQSDAQAKADPNTLVSFDDYPYFGGTRYLAMWYPDPTTNVPICYYSLTKWRADTGQDRHTLFADPKWVSPASADFRLLPGSPNLLNNGNQIGACGTKGVPYASDGQ
jgi:hypothetical protein